MRGFGQILRVRVGFIRLQGLDLRVHGLIGRVRDLAAQRLRVRALELSVHGARYPEELQKPGSGLAGSVYGRSGFSTDVLAVRFALRVSVRSGGTYLYAIAGKSKAKLKHRERKIRSCT